MATGTVEKLKKLEAEAKELRTAAKKEALAAVKAAIADLNSLGFSYELVDAASGGGGGMPTPFKKKAGAKKGAIKRHRDPNKKCPICGETGHDGRFHRKENMAKAKKKA